ncbi:MAG: TIGR00269 family protein [Candidatus Aenigmatarchaeota archaeon]
MSSNCWKCGKTAVIHRKYEGKSWCADHFVEQFESLVKETIRKEELFENDDKVCVALSGGMDSSALLLFLKELLEEWREASLIALAIDEGIEGYRNESLEIARELCEELEVKLHTVSFKDAFGKTLDEIMEEKEHGCTYCGVLRRWLLNRKSRELEADKLATAHNMDDELQSIFMNYLKGNMKRMLRLGAKPAVVDEEKFVPRVKPFRNTPEKEVALYGRLRGLELHQTECPYVEESLRFEVREFLNGMEKKHPSTKYTALRAFDKILPALRKEFSGAETPVQECENCGEMTSRRVCKTCELRNKI